jgi:hypothetical protein
MYLYVTTFYDTEDFLKIILRNLISLVVLQKNEEEDYLRVARSQKIKAKFHQKHFNKRPNYQMEKGQIKTIERPNFQRNFAKIYYFVEI